MKTISVKIDEAIFKELNIRRGGDTISEYLRRIIDTHLDKQDSRFENIKQPITAYEIKTLAIYLTEIVKLGNQLVYTNQTEQIKYLFRKFLERLEGEKS